MIKIKNAKGLIIYNSDFRILKIDVYEKGALAPVQVGEGSTWSGIRIFIQMGWSIQFLPEGCSLNDIEEIPDGQFEQG